MIKIRIRIIYFKNITASFMLTLSILDKDCNPMSGDITGLP
jgi:hypothetical protein